MTAEVLLLLLLLQTGWAFKLSARKAVMGKDVNIPCSFTVKNYPIDRKFLLITWYFQGKEILRVQNAAVKPTDHRMSYTGRTEDGIADLSIANITIMDGGIYTCSILYTPRREEKEIRLDIQAPPQVTITEKLVLKNRLSVLHCAISGFYPVDIDVKWLRDGETLGNVTVEKPQRDPDGTYRVRSSVTITPTKEDRERIFSCRVQHESLTAPHREDFQLVYGAIPTVHISSQEFKLNVEQNLVCKASEFYPESITVNWFLNGNLVGNAKTRRIGNSAVESVYHFTPTQENWGMELSCVVEHGTLTTPHVEKLLVQGLDLTAKRTHNVIILAIVLFLMLVVIFYVLYTKKTKMTPPEVEMIQIPKLFVKEPGRLQCTISDFSPDELTVTWLKKENGKEELIDKDNNGKYKILNSKSQFQVDKTFTRTEYLELIPSLEDARSEMICRVSHPSLKEAIEVRTGPLQVLVTPKVQQPVQLLINSSGDMVADLSLFSFYPERIEVTWTYGPTQEKPSEETLSTNADGTFTVTSRCTIPRNLFEDPQFRARVTWDHPSMESPEYREISIRDPDFPWWPKIKEITPLILQAHKETTVRCTVSGYFLKNNRVTWIMKKGGTLTDCTMMGQRYHTADIIHERLPDNSYQCSPSLSFTPTSDEEDLEFICRVEHPSLGHPIEKSTGPAKVNVAPNETDVKLTPYESDKVLCSLVLKKFYPQDITIKWSNEGNAAILASTKKITQTNDEKLFDAVSECIVPWKSSVRVTWTHDSLQEPEYRNLRPADYQWQPDMEVIEQVFISSAQRKLQCQISGYFPDDLTVSWHKTTERAIPFVLLDNGNKYKTEVIRRQRRADNTYSCTATLLFTPTLEEDQRSEFICRVEHPSLEQPIEKRIGPLQIIVTPQEMEPVRFSFNESGEMQCTLNLKRFYPQDIKVKWSRGETETELTSSCTTSEDGETFDVTSVCTLPRPLCFPVYVTWHHQSVTQPQRILLKSSDPPWHPHVEELESLDLKLNTESQLKCRISGYFPENLTVRWMKLGTDGFDIVDNTKYNTPDIEHQRRADNTYSCTATLLFTPKLEEDQRSEFICRVEHPSLEQPIERRIGPLQIIDPQQMNQHEMSDAEDVTTADQQGSQV